MQHLKPSWECPVFFVAKTCGDRKVAGCCGLRLNDQEEARRKQAEPW